MGNDPVFPISLGIDSYTPGLNPQDENGRAGQHPALPLKRIANSHLLL